MLVRAAIAFLALPGMVAYAIPLLLRPEEARGDAWAVAGALAVGAGSVLLLWCTREFYVAGRGTVAPWSPPQKLVTGGPYSVSRNPMYVAVVIVLCGWCVWFASRTLILYTVAVAGAFHLRILFYEEPRLHKAFGDPWLRYRMRVGRWFMK